MVESKYGRGTIFSVDVNHREYWVTAKHILTGAEHPPYGSIDDQTASLRILNPGGTGLQFVPETFKVIDPGANIDIVVLASATPILNNPGIPMADSANIVLGGDCEFLGYPFGGGYRARFQTGSYWMPFVKRCNVSAISTEGKKVWILDGINNAGFSGGPVIFGTGASQKIMAVISGYITEPAAVIASIAGDRAYPKSGNTNRSYEKVNVNSGFIIAFDIGYAIDAINKHPIGPLLKSAN